jgi:hypothetical protein
MRIGESSGNVRTASSSFAEVDNNSEQIKILKRSMNGVLNKASEENLETSVKELLALYSTHSRTDATVVLTQVVFDSALNEFRVNKSLCRLFAALMSGLHILVGQTFGAHFLEKLAQKFQSEHKLMMMGATEGAHGATSKKCANIATILSNLYNNGTLHCSVMYSFIKTLVASCSEVDVELLLILLKNRYDKILLFSFHASLQYIHIKFSRKIFFYDVIASHIFLWYILKLRGGGSK